jgi:hypothetical protein
MSPFPLLTMTGDSAAADTATANRIRPWNLVRRHAEVMLGNVVRQCRDTGPLDRHDSVRFGVEVTAGFRPAASGRNEVL